MPQLLRSLVLTALLLAVPRVSAAQHADDTRRVSALPQWELRADATAASRPDAQVGIGVNVRAGWYARVGGALSAGAVRNSDGAWQGTQRIDLSARFLLDPFKERPLGLYGGAGVSARFVAGDADPVLLLLVGVEGRPRPHWTPSAELSLGGGVRAGVVLRRTRAGYAR